MKKTEQEALSAYVTEAESAQTAPVKQAQEVAPIRQQEGSMEDSARQMRYHGREDLPTQQDTGLEYKDNLGYMPISVESLPTQGLFYVEGTKITIRAARGAEIKHWSTMNDQDLNQLSQVDDILNYIIERCVNVTMPGIAGANWKDLKDVDRFYLLLAVREFTFLNNQNELMVPVAEGKEIPVRKEHIDFIEIPENIMKHYNNEKKCFEFNFQNGKTINMYIPSLGATQWLKNYAQSKAAQQQKFDTDFILFAPMLIGDFRRLSQRAYEEMVQESQYWTAKEWSVVSYVRDALQNAAQAKIKYMDEEDGSEVNVPLNFRGGIKALFTIYDPLSDLC